MTSVSEADPVAGLSRCAEYRLRIGSMLLVGPLPLAWERADCFTILLPIALVAGMVWGPMAWPGTWMSRREVTWTRRTLSMLLFTLVLLPCVIYSTAALGGCAPSPLLGITLMTSGGALGNLLLTARKIRRVKRLFAI